MRFTVSVATVAPTSESSKQWNGEFSNDKSMLSAAVRFLPISSMGFKTGNFVSLTSSGVFDVAPMPLICCAMVGCWAWNAITLFLDSNFFDNLESDCTVKR